MSLRRWENKEKVNMFTATHWFKVQNLHHYVNSYHFTVFEPHDIGGNFKGNWYKLIKSSFTPKGMSCYTYEDMERALGFPYSACESFHYYHLKKTGNEMVELREAMLDLANKLKILLEKGMLL